MLPRVRFGGAFILAASVILAAVAHASIVKQVGRYQIAGSGAVVARLDTIEGTVRLCRLDGSAVAFRCLDGIGAASSVSDYDPALEELLKALEGK